MKMRGILTKWPDDLLAKIDADAKEEGIGRSEWLRLAAKSRLNRKIVPTVTPDVKRLRPVAQFRSLERRDVTPIPKKGKK